MLTLPPETGVEEQELFNVEEAVADIESKLPGLLRYMDPSDPGMHATDTIDFEVGLEGTVAARTRRRRRGQRLQGRRHAWCRTAQATAAEERHR